MTMQVGQEAQEADYEAIRQIVLRQFEALSWNDEQAPDWHGFAQDFLPGARLHPAARPLKPQQTGEFIARMQALAAGSLATLDEACEGIEILLYGNIAVAMSVCRLVENGAEASRNIEAMLLVKENGRWLIASQAWDSEQAGLPLPGQLASNPERPEQEKESDG